MRLSAQAFHEPDPCVPRLSAFIFRLHAQSFVFDVYGRIYVSIQGIAATAGMRPLRQRQFAIFRAAGGARSAGWETSAGFYQSLPLFVQLISKNRADIPHPLPSADSPKLKARRIAFISRLSIAAQS
jgi:hypothetical protein